MILHHCIIILQMWCWYYSIFQMNKFSKIGWPWMKNQFLRQIYSRTAVLAILHFQSDLLFKTSRHDLASPYTDCYDGLFSTLLIWRSVMLVMSSGLKPWFSLSVSSEVRCADFGKDLLTGNDTLDDLLRDLCRWLAERSVELGDALNPWDTSAEWTPSSKQDVDQARIVFLYSFPIYISTYSYRYAQVWRHHVQDADLQLSSTRFLHMTVRSTSTIYHRFIVTLT